MRRTKIICTIGPKTANYNQLEKLAAEGMNIARLNMSHGDHEWHRKVVKAIRTINEKGNYSVATLLDTKGSEVRSGDLKNDIILSKGERFTFTVKRKPEYPENTTEVSYDGFINDVHIGDVILIDGGMINLKVVEKTQYDIVCECLDGGILSSRRHLNVRGKGGHGPSITEKDWEDIRFAIEEGIDFIALSFVKDAQSIIDLKKYLDEKKSSIDVLAKIESAEALKHIEAIVDVSDGVMVARGDLGSEIPLEEVPLVQEEIVMLCRKKNKPVIVATHLLESMISYPTPTRAEVTDITQAVKQRADAIMLSGETASGKFPHEALQTMARVAEHIDEKLSINKAIDVEHSDDSKKELAFNAAIMANNLSATAVIVITRRGYMATLVSRCRPNAKIFAFTNTTTVRRRLNLYWGITSFRTEFSSDPEKTIQRGITFLKARKLLSAGERIVIVSDIIAGSEFIETIQIRTIKE